jgi:hypothetical protein
MVDPGPINTFVMIVQREDGINDAWYRIDMEAGGFVESPAFYHNGADNLLFGDGCGFRSNRTPIPIRTGQRSDFVGQ